MTINEVAEKYGLAPLETFKEEFTEIEFYWNLEEEGEMKDGLYTRHEVACIIADLLGGTCACDYSGNDEWLPHYCEFADNECPNTVGVACWEQYLMHKDERSNDDR